MVDERKREVLFGIYDKNDNSLFEILEYKLSGQIEVLII